MQENGGYCLPCVLFARSTDARKGKGVFVEAAFTNFKKLCDLHASREYHKDAVAACDACDAFVGVMSGRCESVAVQLNQKFHGISSVQSLTSLHHLGVPSLSRQSEDLAQHR